MVIWLRFASLASLCPQTLTLNGLLQELLTFSWPFPGLLFVTSGLQVRAAGCSRVWFPAHGKACECAFLQSSAGPGVHVIAALLTAQCWHCCGVFHGALGMRCLSQVLFSGDSGRQPWKERGRSLDVIPITESRGGRYAAPAHPHTDLPGFTLMPCVVPCHRDCGVLRRCLSRVLGSVLCT